MRRTRVPILAVSLILVLASSSACTPNDADRRAHELEVSRVVSFLSPDGVRLSGRLFGTGTVGVVLSHMLPADQTSWWDFASELADQGYMALTYDFRGYCPGGDAGCSGGGKDVAAIWQDVLGAIDEVRSAGASRVALVGASMGGTASLVAASKPGVEVQAVVTLSAPASIEGLVADSRTLATVTAAKLFIAGNGDPTGSANAAQGLYDSAPQPKRVDIVTSNDHGTDLLTGNQSGIVRTTILNYLQEYAPS